MNYMEDESIKYVYKTKYTDKEQKYMNLYKNHLSYIPDLIKLAKSFVCANCGSSFSDNRVLLKHGNNCEVGVKNTFEYKDTIWTKNKNIIIETCDYYDLQQQTDFKYDYSAVFDLESVLMKNTTKRENLDKLQFISTHVAVSASIASNIPGSTETKFILSRDPKDLCNQWFTYFDQLSQEANKLMSTKFKYILDSEPQT